MRKYKTVQGDMWDAIAYRELGSTSYTDALMNVNQNNLTYFTFPAGIELNLPDIETDSLISDSTPPWKKVTA